MLLKTEKVKIVKINFKFQHKQLFLNFGIFEIWSQGIKFKH